MTEGENFGGEAFTSGGGCGRRWEGRLEFFQPGGRVGIPTRLLVELVASFTSNLVEKRRRLGRGIRKPTGGSTSGHVLVESQWGGNRQLNGCY